MFSSNVNLSLLDDNNLEIADKSSSSITSDAVKRATSTQALADFLSSTGPEEFLQKTAAKRGSKLFSRLLKKPSSHMKPPAAEGRKKYVEIVPNYPQPRDDWNSSGISTSSAATKCAMEISKALSSQNLKVPSYQPPPYQAIKEMTHVEPRKSLKENVSPVPPVPLKNARRSSKISLASSSAGEHQIMGSPSPSIQASALEERRNEARRKAGRRTSRSHEMDLVEAALSQRMEARRKSFASSNRSSSATTASDFMATEIANEHVKALQLTSVGHIDAVEANANRKRRTLTSSPPSITSVPAAALNRRRVRHAQVQTTDFPVNLNPGSAVSIETQTDGISEPSISISSSTDSDTTMVDRRKSSMLEDDDLTTELYHTIEMLQQQLAEEQRSKRRLIAAMRDSRDKNELLSALAYKKLRELWEEKCKWEGDCLELRGRLMEMEGNETCSM
ncbi:hypothetical protein INT43_001558 [Umbelopsis isabellina]|uniref:Uncharacterized protein n=1 Tax=Mortierella isabellina TaxID=91625 RepID=A0A8H7PEZ4_MORIS|nr:hypothetical protein INT43_001558 [Umbelopsis isabellina]